MRIVTLIEDANGHPQCCSEHGFSVYVETGKHKVLMDTGATSAFLGNAERLNILLNQVDTVILSHGHYDHSGGLLDFCQLNSKAQIYMQQSALGDYYHGERYIGIDKAIRELPNVHFLRGDYRIDEEISLFTDIKGRKFYPQSNLQLSQKVNGNHVQDLFEHEQCLVIHAQGHEVLLSGCAHNGILNILDRYQQVYHSLPDYVISGFHMMKKTEYTQEEIQTICDTARELKKYPSRFYTGHCTGQKAIELMKPIMGDQLTAIYSGCEWEIS